MSRPKEPAPRVSVDGADALDALFEASLHGVMLLTADGRLARLNPQACRDLEAEDAATAVGREWISFWPPEERPAASAAFERAIRGEKAAFQGFCPTLRGAPRWWDVVVAPVRTPAGEIGGAFAILRELSEGAPRRHAFITLVEGGVIAGWNAQAQALFGWSAEEAIGQTVDRFLPERLHARSRIWSDDVLATGVAEHLGKAIRTVGLRRTGEEFPVECVISALPSADGWMLLSSIQDLSTSRAQTELFENAFQSAPIGQALVSLEGRFLKLNPAFCALLASDEATLLAGGFQAITHPDDLDLDLANLQQLVAGEIPAYQMDKRYVRPDGSVVWVNLSVSLVRFADGRPKFFISQVQDLTARRAAEGRYRLLAENVSDVVSMQDAAGRCLYASPSAERMFGYRPEDVIGKPPTDFVPENAHASYRVLAEKLAARPRGETVTQQLPLLRKDGGAAWVEISCRNVDDDDGRPVTVVVTRDVTRRLETERRYRLLADNMADILVLADLDGRMNFVAGACERILGWTPAEIQAQRSNLLVHPEDYALVNETFRRVGRGERGLRVRFRSRCKDGDPRWLESQPSLFEGEDGSVGVVDAIRDVTDQVAQEAALALAREEAEAAALAKARFLANMSHEIRTPLTSVIGFTDLLLERHALQPEARRCAEHIGSASRALLTLVNDVLDFSKIEAGQFDIHPAPAQPVRLVEEALAIFAAAAERKGVGVRLETRLDAGFSVDIDAARVRQILLNLIGNAMKFTERGEVVVGLQRAHGRLAITVRDSGPGIAPEDQRKLFQRFSQVDASTTRQHGGTGLGLAISKGLVEAMGGSISVRSRLGHGAAFSFDIAAPASAEQPPSQAPADEAHIDRVRILAADDNPANRELVRAILEGFGAEITLAEDGRQACDLAAATPFDVILMDLRMPRLDGRGALRRIRDEAGPNQHTPMLAFTADVLETEVADFDGAVGKPIEPLKLAAAIEACLARAAKPGSEVTTAARL